MIHLRPYQQEAIDAVLDYWRAGGGNPLVDMATGLGKSMVIGKLTHDLLREYDMRVLMLVHVQELVQQNAQALLRIWPDAPVGIYSAGLGRRDTHHRITFASVQSVYRRAAMLGPRHLVLIDEAHLVPNGGDGMYRTLLAGLRETVPDLRVAGFTATPYRMDSGRLDAGGDDRLFDQIVYSYGIARGIEDAWLSPLISKRGATEIDVTGVAKRGGEFVTGSLEAAADQDYITRAAVEEIIRYGADRRSWLVFCAGVKHAHHVREAMQAAGVSCATITGDTDAGERARAIADFKAGRLRCLTNANVLTTGFDAPGLDLIALLRPTLSPGLFVQMAGRGTRLADGKDNCLFLDFTGTVRRMGPVDTITIDPKSSRSKDADAVKLDTVRAKECPTCKGMMPLACRTCRDCGHEWEMVEAPKHDAEADDTPILSRDLPKGPQEEPVVSWSARRHVKFGGTDSLCVTYSAGLMQYREFICLEHTAFARDKAERWWLKHGGAKPVPATVDEGEARFGELTMPAAIQVRQNGKWFDVIGRRFPDSNEEGIRGAA